MIKWRFWQREVHSRHNDRPIEIKDDWVIVSTDGWTEVNACHCGHICRYVTYIGDVCPGCGHKDKWSKIVIRYTNEYSLSRHLAYKPCGEHFERNFRHEVWDESKCGVKS